MTNFRITKFGGAITLLSTKENKNRKRCEKGFTLIEIMAVIAILAILITIAVPSYLGYITKTEKDVCNVNTSQLERMYKTHLTIENVDHTEATFDQYLQEYGEETCPAHGKIIYVDGSVQCSIHPRSDKSEDRDKEDGSVPFL